MFSKIILVAYYMSIFLLLSSTGLPRQDFLLFATAQEEYDNEENNFLCSKLIQNLYLFQD